MEPYNLRVGYSRGMVFLYRDSTVDSAGRCSRDSNEGPKCLTLMYYSKYYSFITLPWIQIPITEILYGSFGSSRKDSATHKSLAKQLRSPLQDPYATLVIGFFGGIGVFGPLQDITPYKHDNRKTFLLPSETRPTKNSLWLTTWFFSVVPEFWEPSRQP